MMTLRATVVRKPHLRFRTGVTYTNTIHDAVTLAEGDITCRIEADGSASLRIGPDGVKCRIRSDGTGELVISVFGPLLHVRLDLDAGVISKTQLLPAEQEFWLAIWCEDGLALQQALGRFWGSEEKV
jgi:hypothetical protein